MTELLNRLTEIVPSANNLEELARPILDLMHGITGMESTYFTTIDLARDTQTVKYASNTGAMQIPENLEVRWGDTLCKRALDEGRSYENRVDSCWGDSQAAKALGIKTYVSTAVKNNEGRVMGTLCAASTDSLSLDGQSLAMMALFSKLLALFMERELLVRQLARMNGALASQAMHDPLTGLSNRRALDEALPALLARCRIDGTPLFIAVIDLDGFKQINDLHGHQAGDVFLQQIAGRLLRSVRGDDFLARLGGDEFVVVSPAFPEPGVPTTESAEAFRDRLFGATTGEFDLGLEKLWYSGASVGVVSIGPGAAGAEQALALADARMYEVKRRRKNAASSLLT